MGCFAASPHPVIVMKTEEKKAYKKERDKATCKNVMIVRLSVKREPTCLTLVAFLSSIELLRPS